MFRMILAAALALSLVACSADKISPAESILLSCDAFASGLKTLAPLRAQGKLGAGTVKLVDDTREVVDPICLGQAPDVDGTVKALAVDNGVKLLTGIAAQFLLK